MDHALRERGIAGADFPEYISSFFYGQVLEKTAVPGSEPGRSHADCTRNATSRSDKGTDKINRAGNSKGYRAIQEETERQDQGTGQEAQEGQSAALVTRGARDRGSGEAGLSATLVTMGITHTQLAGYGSLVVFLLIEESGQLYLRDGIVFESRHRKNPGLFSLVP